MLDTRISMFEHCWNTFPPLNNEVCRITLRRLITNQWLINFWSNKMYNITHTEHVQMQREYFWFPFPFHLKVWLHSIRRIIVSWFVSVHYRCTISDLFIYFQISDNAVVSESEQQCFHFWEIQTVVVGTTSRAFFLGSCLVQDRSGSWADHLEPEPYKSDGGGLRGGWKEEEK